MGYDQPESGRKFLPERLSLEQFYEAAFNEQAYADLLTEIAKRIGARSFAAGWHFRDGTAAMFLDSGHWSPEQIALYDTDFAVRDIWSTAQLANWKANRLTNLL